MALDFGDMLTIDKYVALANEFAGSKDDALVGEAGGCAIYLFAESCHLHHGDSFWVMEANKLWRACVKKAKARRRSSAQRGGCGDESFLAEELRKAAHRLVPPDVFGGGRAEVDITSGFGGLDRELAPVVCIPAPCAVEDAPLSPLSASPRRFARPPPSFELAVLGTPEVEDFENFSEGAQEEVGALRGPRRDGGGGGSAAAASAGGASEARPPTFEDLRSLGAEERKESTLLLSEEILSEEDVLWPKAEEASVVSTMSREDLYHKVSEPSESSQLEATPEVTELQGELRRLKAQLSKQAMISHAHEAEIRRLRAAKYELARKTSNAEATRVQAAWRRAALAKRASAAVRRERALVSAVVLVQARARGCAAARETRAAAAARRDRAAGRVARAVRRGATRARAAVVVQAAVRGATATRGPRLRRLARETRRLADALEQSWRSARGLNDALQLERAAHAIDLHEAEDLTMTACELAGLAANGACAAADAGRFGPAVDALRCGVRGVVVPVIAALARRCCRDDGDDVTLRHAAARDLVAAGVPNALLQLIDAGESTDDARRPRGNHTPRSDGSLGEAVPAAAAELLADLADADAAALATAAPTAHVALLSTVLDGPGPATEEAAGRALAALLAVGDPGPLHDAVRRSRRRRGLDAADRMKLLTAGLDIAVVAALPRWQDDAGRPDSEHRHLQTPTSTQQQHGHSTTPRSSAPSPHPTPTFSATKKRHRPRRRAR